MAKAAGVFNTDGFQYIQPRQHFDLSTNQRINPLTNRKSANDFRPALREKIV
jgi:hypothetical protein